MFLSGNIGVDLSVLLTTSYKFSLILFKSGPDFIVGLKVSTQILSFEASRITFLQWLHLQVSSSPFLCYPISCIIDDTHHAWLLSMLIKIKSFVAVWHR